MIVSKGLQIANIRHRGLRKIGRIINNGRRGVVYQRLHIQGIILRTIRVGDIIISISQIITHYPIATSRRKGVSSSVNKPLRALHRATVASTRRACAKRGNINRRTKLRKRDSSRRTTARSRSHVEHRTDRGGSCATTVAIKHQFKLISVARNVNIRQVSTHSMSRKTVFDTKQQAEKY